MGRRGAGAAGARSRPAHQPPSDSSPTNSPTATTAARPATRRSWGVGKLVSHASLLQNAEEATGRPTAPGNAPSQRRDSRTRRLDTPDQLQGDAPATPGLRPRRRPRCTRRWNSARPAPCDRSRRARACAPSPSSSGIVSSRVRSGASPPVAKPIGRPQRLERQPPSRPLIGVRREQEPIDQHDGIACERRAGSPSRTSCARDAAKSNASLSAASCDAGSSSTRAQHVARRRAAGLAQRHDVDADGAAARPPGAAHCVVLPTPSPPSRTTNSPRCGAIGHGASITRTR